MDPEKHIWDTYTTDEMPPLYYIDNAPLYIDKMIINIITPSAFDTLIVELTVPLLPQAWTSLLCYINVYTYNLITLVQGGTSYRLRVKVHLFTVLTVCFIPTTHAR